MNQMIFDYLCDQCDSGDVEGLVDDNVYYAARYIANNFNHSEIYDQIDRLLDEYLENYGQK